MLEYGIGLTDVAKTHSGVDAQITADAYDPAEIHRKVLLYEPRVLAFNGKKAASMFYDWKANQPIEYGPQDLWIGNTQVWILPSTSGSASGYWDIMWWHKLAARVVDKLST